MDPVTGSITWKTTWPFGLTSAPHTDVSPLETRLKSRGIAWTPSWQFLHNTHRNIFGVVTCDECGTAPPIYQLRPVLKEFAAASTDSELREFVWSMQSGTDAQRQAAVQTATEKGLAAVSATPIARPLLTKATTMPTKKWPPPGFPLVTGKCALTAEWSIDLPQQFARRTEDGSLVLWRPGLTIWLCAWGNDKHETQAQRLAWLKSTASPHRFDARESVSGGATRLSYRLRDENEDGPVESLNAYVINDSGYLQLSAYFDDLADAADAQQLVDSVTLRRHD